MKGSEPHHQITFESETASKERKAFFITPMHPFVKQAAKYFSSSIKSYIHLEYYSDDLPEGRYYFSIYAWNYVGLHPMFKVVPVCNSEIISSELTDILQNATSLMQNISIDQSPWNSLEGIHYTKWQTEKEQYLSNVLSTANYKLESISSNFRNRKRTLEEKIREAFDEKIRRMYQSELDTATENYNARVAEINDTSSRADIHTSLIANGILDIKKE